MISSRVTKAAFKSIRPGRTWRFMPQIAGAAVLAAGVSAAVAFPAVAAAAQAHPSRTPAVPSTFTVTSPADTGPGTLRDAINSVNATLPGSSSQILFGMHGTITLNSALPAISREVAIDATTAPTHVSGGPPVVAIDFKKHPGLRFDVGSAGSRLLGVAVDGASADGVALDAGQITLNDDYIGLNLAGAAAGNGDDGVYVSPTSSGDVIGLNPSGAPGVVGNVISGNVEDGIHMEGSSSTIAANRIGTNPAGTSAIPNNEGVELAGVAQGNVIGGTPAAGNLISGNLTAGVFIEDSASGNVLDGNFVGTTASGDGAVPNGDGLLITATGGGNLVRANVFSGNARNGIELAGNALGVTILPNIAGLNTAGTAALPNGGDGLLIGGSAHQNVIGGTLSAAIPQNTFSGNTGHGVAITGSAYANHVTLSYIGTDIGGVSPLGNRAGGVLVGDHAFFNLIGGPQAMPSNLISGNGGAGVTLGGGTFDNAVIRNYIGLDRLGHYLPNSGTPVVNGNYLNAVQDNQSTPSPA
jgi:hypothetical protein